MADEFIAGLALRKLLLGTGVAKVGSDPTAAADDLYTVTGQVLVTLLYGTVTTAISGGTAPELLVNIKDGSNTALCVSTVITNDAVDTLYMITGDFGIGINGGDAPIVGGAQAANSGSRPFILDDVTVEITPGGGAIPTGGVIDWMLFYVPLTDGASVVAA